jgi:hypothetical protein
MLVHINRKIFKELPEDLRKEYVKETLYPVEYKYDLDIDAINNLAEGIEYLITKNENIIKKYGWESYLNEDYPAYDHCSGVHYSTGKYGIMFFDIQADTIEDLNYSFSIFEVL